MIGASLVAPVRQACAQVPFENYTGVTAAVAKKPFSEPRFGILRRGGYLAGRPYEEGAPAKRNIVGHLKPQTPVILTAEHGQFPFLFAESKLFAGWIRRDDVVFVDLDTFIKRVFAPKVILKRDVIIDGVLFPLATELELVKSSDTGYAVAITGNDGAGTTVEIAVAHACSPVESDGKNLRFVSSLFKDRPYAWGNSDEGWDCSGLLVDYFSFFGIRIPRNSSEQINYVRKVSVAGKSRKEKERILRSAKPYFTLLYFPGHIMLYTGRTGKEYMSFQALNRIGRKQIAKVGYFPLVRTGLLRRVTAVGFVEGAGDVDLTERWLEGKI